MAGETSVQYLQHEPLVVTEPRGLQAVVFRYRQCKFTNIKMCIISFVLVLVLLNLALLFFSRMLHIGDISLVVL